MKRSATLIALSACVAFIDCAYNEVIAQEAATKISQPRRITPADAVNLSAEQQAKIRFSNLLKINPEIATARINVTASEYIKDGAKAAFYPKISVGANASSSSTISNRQSTDVTVRQPVYTAGRLTARMKSAETDATIADSSFNKTVQDVVLDAMLAHSNLSRNALLVDASRAAESAVSQLLALELKRLELGGSGVTDAQFAKARLAVTQDRLVNYEGQLNEAKASYFRYFGAYPEGNAIPELEVPKSQLPPALDDAVNKAMFANPEIRTAEIQITKARYNYTAEDASQYPSVDVVGIQQFFGEADPFTGKRTDSSVNLRLSYSAFSGGEQVARVNQAAATIDTRRAQLNAARLKVAETVRFQWGKWVAGQGRANTLRGAYGDSLSVFKNRKRLRDFGRETVIVMLDAQVEYFNVLIAYINAVFDARDAGIRLLHATGGLMPPKGTEAEWFSGFFATVPERPKLEESLRATEEITSNPSDQAIAEKLGISVDQKEVEKASQFTLTPEQKIDLQRGSEAARTEGRVFSTPGEKSVKPALKPSSNMERRFGP